MKCVIGVDQGTSGTRSSLYSADGELVATAYRAHRQLHPCAGCVEHDPREIWSHTHDTLSEVAERLPPGSQVVAMGLANQGESVLAWNRTDCAPLYNALVWQDTRTAPDLPALAEHADEVRRRTGLLLDSYFSAPKLQWLARRIPPAPGVAYTTLDSWLLARLTAGQTFATDPSTAARTLLFPLHGADFDPFLLDLFHIQRDWLPQVQPSVGTFGVISDLHTALDGVPVTASLVDQPAAMVGNGCIDSGNIKATFGTGCFVYLNTGSAARASTNGLLTTVAWQRDGATTFALDGGVFAAGSAVAWLRRLGLITGAGEIDRLCAAGVDTCGVTFVPALAGLAAPYWQRQARAAWSGLGLATTRGDLVAAAVRGIACRVVEVIRAMERDAATRITALRVDGGLTGCRTLMQMQADLLGVPVQVGAEPEATAAGAAYLAARGAGLWSDDEPIRRLAGVAATYQPRIGAEERRDQLQRFAEAVARVGHG